jgi:murein L,D-transpeptidase YcbB/YkuD
MNIIYNDTIPLKDKIKYILNKDNLTRLGFNDDQQKVLQDFYSKRNYSPLWINDSTLNESGKAMDLSVKKSMHFGIPDKRLHFTKNDDKLNWVEREVYLTAQISGLISDLNNGFLFPDKQEFKDKKLEKLDSLEFFKEKYVKCLDSIFISQGVSDTNYQKLSQQLYRFCEKYPLNAKTFNVCSEEKDSLKAYTETKKALIFKGYLDSAKIDDPKQFKLALFTFQEHNGLTKQKYINSYTAECLNESTYSKVIRACYALERLRWQIQKPKKFININIPEYLLRFYHDDTLRATHKVIVGKVGTPTPTLASKIYEIVSFPYWTVPQSIASNEILPAVKKNSAYLNKNNYRIYGKSGEISPSSVNWSKIKGGFPYRIVQDPGKSNSLGIVKFEFHNKYGVYLHDTPSKNLFNRDIRAFSHGCMRCKDPVDLAKLILDYDSIPNKRNYYTRDSLDTLITKTIHEELKLISPIPIYVEYVTVTVGEDYPIFHFDIYRKEKEIITFLSNE